MVAAQAHRLAAVVAGQVAATDSGVAVLEAAAAVEGSDPAVELVVTELAVLAAFELAFAGR